MDAIDFGGSGPGILLLHGLMGRAQTWSETAGWLTRHGHVVATDAQGHGGVPFGQTDTRVEDAIATIENYGLGPALIIGHSMGGITAWQLAGRRPDLVRAIVIEDIGLDGPGTNASWRQWFESWPLPFPSREAAYDYFGPTGRIIGEVMVETPTGFVPHFAFEDLLKLQLSWENRDHTDDLRKVECPALVVKGQNSRISPESMRQTAKTLHFGQYAEVPDADHVVHYDNPAGWRSAVESFVQSALD